MKLPLEKDGWERGELAHKPRSSSSKGKYGYNFTTAQVLNRKIENPVARFLDVRNVASS